MLTRLWEATAPSCCSPRNTYSTCLPLKPLIVVNFRDAGRHFFSFRQATYFPTNFSLIVKLTWLQLCTSHMDKRLLISSHPILVNKAKMYSLLAAQSVTLPLLLSQIDSVSAALCCTKSAHFICLWGFEWVLALWCFTLSVLPQTCVWRNVSWKNINCASC